MDMSLVIQLCEKEYMKSYPNDNFKIVKDKNTQTGYSIDIDSIEPKKRDLVIERFNQIMKEVCTVLAFLTKEEMQKYGSIISFRLH